MWNDGVVANDGFAGGVGGGSGRVPVAVPTLDRGRTYQVVALVASIVGIVAFAVPIRDAMFDAFWL